MSPDQTAPKGAVFRSSPIWVHTVCKIGFQSVKADNFGEWQEKG